MNQLEKAGLSTTALALLVFGIKSTLTVVEAAESYQKQAKIKDKLYGVCMAEATQQYSAIASEDKIQGFCLKMVYGGGQ